jgi:hypothetical protein
LSIVIIIHNKNIIKIILKLVCSIVRAASGRPVIVILYNEQRRTRASTRITPGAAVRMIEDSL